MSFGGCKTYNGKSVSELSRETGLKVSTINYRLRNGWNWEDAISTPVLSYNQASRKHYIVGKTFCDRFGNEYIVQCQVENSKSGTPMYKVRFFKSGYEQIVSGAQIAKGNVQDRYSPSVFGIGIKGDGHRADDIKMYDVWRSMLARCYNPKNPRYKTYGAKGITVCERWKRFDYFLKDVVQLPGYNKQQVEEGKIVLDKDTIDRSKMTYSPETCCFITKSENSKEAAKRMKAQKMCND